MNSETGAWQVVVDDYEGGGHRFDCATVAVGSKIFVFGGLDNRGPNRTWDSFDVLTTHWASATIPEESRRLPLDELASGRAVLLPPLCKLD